MTVLDLFCGCGGMSYGFCGAGYRVSMGVDVWNDALNTFESNIKGAKTYLGDLSEIDPNELSLLLGGINPDVIIGGPPCQGFSIAGKRIIEDKRNELYKAFVRIVDFFHPKAFVMENVPNILSMGDGIIKNAILNDFSQIGYRIVFKVLNASDYGVPQDRRRAFFVGLRTAEEFVFPTPNNEKKVAVKDAISDLPEMSLEDGTPYPTPSLSAYQTLMREYSDGIFNHRTTNHTDKTQEIIALVPDGGNYKNLPLDLQSSRKVHIAWTRLNSQKPSFTIDTGHRHHFHYKYNRVPTVRESARLQSFDDKFVFLGSKTSQYKQVGNAVPPLLSQAIATELLKYL